MKSWILPLFYLGSSLCIWMQLWYHDASSLATCDIPIPIKSPECPERLFFLVQIILTCCFFLFMVRQEIHVERNLVISFGYRFAAAFFFKTCVYLTTQDWAISLTWLRYVVTDTIAMLFLFVGLVSSAPHVLTLISACVLILSLLAQNLFHYYGGEPLNPIFCVVIAIVVLMELFGLWVNRVKFIFCCFYQQNYELYNELQLDIPLSDVAWNSYSLAMVFALTASSQILTPGEQNQSLLIAQCCIAFLGLLFFVFWVCQKQNFSAVVRVKRPFLTAYVLWWFVLAAESTLILYSNRNTRNIFNLIRIIFHYLLILCITDISGITIGIRSQAMRQENMSFLRQVPVYITSFSITITIVAELLYLTQLSFSNAHNLTDLPESMLITGYVIGIIDSILNFQT